MPHGRLSKVFVLIISALSVCAFAATDEKSNSRFANVDALLMKAIESPQPAVHQSLPVEAQQVAAKPIIDGSVSANQEIALNPIQQPASNNVANQQQPIPVNALRQESANYGPDLTPKAQSIPVWSSSKPTQGLLTTPGGAIGELNNPDVLATRFTEIPTGTIMELGTSIDIPANKSGVYFENGKKTAAISDPDGMQTIALLADKVSAGVSACAIISDRSNLRIKGISEGQPSQLEVESLSVDRRNSEYIAKIQFKPKPAKNTNQSVTVSIYCGVPKTLDFKSTMTVKQFVDGIDGGISVKLSTLAEI